jgi:nucleotide-binding universal stress UspA family protein
MLKTILVPLDGSPLSEEAIPFARALAHRGQTKLILLRAVLRTNPSTLTTDRFNQTVQAEAEAELGAVADRAREAGIDAEPVIWDDEAGSGITKAARDRHVDLIVMSTHGRTGLGRAMYGSVADHVVRTASTPVVLVPPNASFNWGPPFRVVVGLDGSRMAEKAIEPSLDLAESLRGEIVLVQAVEPSAAMASGLPTPFTTEDLADAVEDARRYLATVAKSIRRPGVEAFGTAAAGTPQQVIFDAARSYRAGAIAVATHGRGGLTRMLMGSVAERILSATAIPLLLVHPAAVRRQHVHVRREQSAGQATLI